MLVNNQYRCELLFRAIRKYSYHYDTIKNANSVIKSIVLKQVLDDALRWMDKRRPKPYKYTYIVYGKTIFGEEKTSYLQYIANTIIYCISGFFVN